MKIPSFLPVPQTNSSQAARLEKNISPQNFSASPAGRTDSARFHCRTSASQAQDRLLAQNMARELTAPTPPEALDALRNKISAGTYRIDPQAIADAMLRLD